MQPNGYKPAPLDLSAITLTPKLEELVDALAENTHNMYVFNKFLTKTTDA